MSWRCGRVMLVRHFFDNVKGSDLVQEAKKGERRRVSQLQKKKKAEGTNPYNKAQYINAFVEAHSARLTRERRLKEGVAAEQSLLSVIDAARPVLSKVQLGQKYLVPLPTDSTHPAFGSWREGHPAVERACRSVDRNIHCIVRGATTPPDFSPEAMQRTAPIRLASMQELLSRVSGGTRGMWSPSRLRDFTRRMDSCLSSVSGGDSEMLQKLLVVILQQAATTRSWTLALQLFQGCVLPYWKRYGGLTEKVDAGTSILVAVLCESIRSHCLVRRSDNLVGPPFHTVVELSNVSCDHLLPVAAAPLFSILQPSGSATWCDAVAILKRFHKHGQKRMYLPCVAWGEMLRAMRRMGASMRELQTVVDIITDPQRTKHGERNIHDTNIWNAYLATSDWQHALDVFLNNSKHYGVRETAATSSAIMESMLRDRQWARALDVFQRLQKKEGQLIIGTCGVFTAVFQALGQKRDWRAVTLLLTDFDRFLVHFNVPHSWWLASPLRAEANKGASPDDKSFREWMRFVRQLQGHGNVSCELVNAIQSALIACDPRAQPKPGIMRETIAEDILTADGLYEIL